MKIIGMRVEKYIDKAVKGHNCDFEYYDSDFERHIIFGVLDNNKKVQITLSTEEGECGSGWCTATFGHMDVVEVKKFGGYTYTPKKTMIIEDISPSTDVYESDIYNEVFDFSAYGGDDYYPSGGYSVKMDLFIENTRTKEYRPVWLFTGDSNTNKTYLACHLYDVSVCVIKEHDALPDKITQDIILLENEDSFSISDINERIFGNYELCVVEFDLEIINNGSRPLWVFLGDSNTGKSFISSHLKGLSVYETDSSDLLPDNITEDVVVLGNKYEFSLSNIRKRISRDYELIVAEFSGY